MLDAKVSDYVFMARRSRVAWSIGAMTDWDRRKLELKFDFPPAGKYKLEVWRDGANVDPTHRNLPAQRRPYRLPTN